MKVKVYYLLLAAVTLFSFAVRIYRFDEPSRYYFDEVYHAVTAKAYADNNPAAYDPFAPPPKQGTAYDWLHPPLAKLIQASSIKILGDNPVGWRLPSVIFGTAIVPATFVLANLLFGPLVAIFAAAVISFENLNLVMSRITMNDVFITFFAICGFIFTAMYLKTNKFRHLVLTSIFLGLAVASKWTGVYAILVCAFFIILFELKRKRLDAKFSILFVIPAIIYLMSYGQFWLQGHSIQQFIDLHKQIWWYQNRHDLQHSYGTTPIYCVPMGLDGPRTWCPWVLDFRGVYFSYEDYGRNQAGYIYAIGNPLIFWSGIFAISYLIGKYLDKRKKEYLLILGGYFIFWVPWIFTPRILFMYHYLPSLVFLSVSLGLVLAEIYKTKFKYLAIITLLIFAAMFFYLYPITTGYPIDKNSIDGYMLIKTWR